MQAAATAMQATVVALQTQVAGLSNSNPVSAPAPAQASTPAPAPAAPAVAPAAAGGATGGGQGEEVVHYVALNLPEPDPSKTCACVVQWLDIGGQLVGDMRAVATNDAGQMVAVYYRLKGRANGANPEVRIQGQPNPTQNAFMPIPAVIGGAGLTLRDVFGPNSLWTLSPADPPDYYRALLEQLGGPAGEAGAVHGYLADHDAFGNPGAYYLEWMEAGTRIVGDLAQVSGSGSSVDGDMVIIDGTRNGDNLNFTWKNNWKPDGGISAGGGRVQGDTVTVTYTDRRGTAQWALKAASQADFYRAAARLAQNEVEPPTPQPAQAAPGAAQPAPVQPAPVQPAPAAPAPTGSEDRSFLVLKDAAGTPTVLFVQWTQRGDQIAGDLRYVAGPGTLQMPQGSIIEGGSLDLEGGLIKGTFDASGLKLQYQPASDWIDMPARLTDNGLVLGGSDAATGQARPAIAFQPATVADYYAAVDAFMHSQPLPQPGQAAQGAVVQGYMTGILGNTQGVYFVQYSEINGRISGDLRLVQSANNRPPVASEIYEFIAGTRSGESLSLTDWDGAGRARSVQASLQGNRLIYGYDQSITLEFSGPVTESQFDDAVAQFAAFGK